jgi:hypothetical protein
VKGFSNAEFLGWTDEALDELARLRGWTEDAVEQLALAWNSTDGTVGIPIRDATLAKLGTIRYLPDPARRNGRRKMRQPSGVPRQLFPPPESLGDGVHKLVLDEGEPDTIAAWSAGFAAVGVPGTQGWKGEDAARFSGRRWTVYVVGDCDAEGRGLANEAAGDLVAAGVDARVVDLDPARDDGYDLTDFLLERGADGLRALLDTAEPFTQSNAADQRVEVAWFESAADLLAEPDPGPTPFLVDELLVDGAIAALVGPPKHGKTWTLLDIAIAVATGELALSRFAVSERGPVLLILEESGRAALHRRLDMLVRGRAIKPGQLVEFYFAANRRVRLSELEWQKRLLDAATSRPWRLVAFDPLARIKGASVDENIQREIGPVLDFIRDLREASNATVAYSHHTPHDGTRQRGSSDLEAYWESKLTLVKEKGTRTLRAEHREAEASRLYVVSFGFDATTRTVRLRAFEDELEERVREYLDEHPDASANEVDDNVEGNRQRILELVGKYREGGSDSPEPPGTTPPGQTWEVVPGGGSFRTPGTTPPDHGTEVVPEPGTTPDEVTLAEAAAAASSLTRRDGLFSHPIEEVHAEARRLRGET